MTSTDRLIVSVGAPPTAPRIRVTLANMAVLRHADVKLEIVAEGVLPLEYTWQHGNYIMRGENKPYLLLPRVQQKDGGFYAATARNKFGGATSDMVLTIR